MCRDRHHEDNISASRVIASDENAEQMDGLKWYIKCTNGDGKASFITANTA